MNKRIVYHGSDARGITGSSITLDHVGSGNGFVDRSMGKAFYACSSLDLAKYYSHLVERDGSVLAAGDFNKVLSHPERIKMGKVYRIELSPDARIASAQTIINRKKVEQLLTEAGVAEWRIEQQLSGATDIGSLFDCLSTEIPGGSRPRFPLGCNNEYEYIAKALDYDGIRIPDGIWTPPSYNPKHLGIDYSKKPEEIAIYNLAVIKNFDLVEKMGRKLKAPRKGPKF